MLKINKIIKEEWENIVISEQEYNPDDKIDFNAIDLYSEYQKLNKLLFNGNVPEVPMKWSTRKTALGHVKFQRNRKLREVKNIQLWMSTFFDVNYRQFLNTLAHEMIHVLLVSSPNPPQSPHGYEFMKEANRINNMGLGFNITVRNGEDIAMSDIAKKSVSGKKFIGIIFDIDNKNFLAVTSPQVYERDFDSLIRIFDGAVNNRFKYKRVEINVIESQDPTLVRYSQQRNFSRSISYTPLTDEELNNLLDNDIIKTVIIERGKEKIISEEIQ